jgi:hypothetical protein
VRIQDAWTAAFRGVLEFAVDVGRRAQSERWRSE